MATEDAGLPDTLLDRAKEAATNMNITAEELERIAVEQSVTGRDFAGVYGIARRRGQEHGITPENVEGIAEVEIGARRSERRR